MSKRDTYSDDVDWPTVDDAYQAWAHDREMTDLMQPERGITVDECRYGRQW